MSTLTSSTLNKGDSTLNMWETKPKTGMFTSYFIEGKIISFDSKLRPGDKHPTLGIVSYIVIKNHQFSKLHLKNKPTLSFTPSPLHIMSLQPTFQIVLRRGLWPCEIHNQILTKPFVVTCVNTHGFIRECKEGVWKLRTLSLGVQVDILWSEEN